MDGEEWIGEKIRGVSGCTWNKVFNLADDVVLLWMRNANQKSLILFGQYDDQW